MSSLKHKIKVFPRAAVACLSECRKWFLFKVAKNWVILNRISPRLRPWIWKRTGVQIHGKVSIGYDVYYDVGNANLITLDEGVWVASRCLLLCHKRPMRDYCVGDDYNELPHIQRPIHLKKGCCVGMGTIVMPGVTIGEGSVIGTGSVVTRDIPDWCIATGNPAQVVRFLPERRCDSD